MKNTALQKTRGKKEKEKKTGGKRKINNVVKILVKDKSNEQGLE